MHPCVIINISTLCLKQFSLVIEFFSKSIYCFIIEYLEFFLIEQFSFKTFHFFISIVTLTYIYLFRVVVYNFNVVFSEHLVMTQCVLEMLYLNSQIVKLDIFH